MSMSHDNPNYADPDYEPFPERVRDEDAAYDRWRDQQVEKEEHNAGNN